MNSVLLLSVTNVICDFRLDHKANFIKLNVLQIISKTPFFLPHWASSYMFSDMIEDIVFISWMFTSSIQLRSDSMQMILPKKWVEIKCILFIPMFWSNSRLGRRWTCNDIKSHFHPYLIFSFREKKTRQCRRIRLSNQKGKSLRFSDN